MKETTLTYLMKTQAQEIDEVSLGLKPTALGDWDKSEILRRDLFFKRLHPVYGRYYKYAIARCPLLLRSLVVAYYKPISKSSDTDIGIALGYSITTIDGYTKSMKYKTVKEPSNIRHSFMKIKASIQKLGLRAMILPLIGLLARNKIIVHNLKKEGVIWK